MSYIGNIPTTVAFLVDTFSGNGSTTAFTLSQAPANTSSILVAVSGVVQDPSTYSVSGTTLTFSGAPPSGSSNISVRFLGIPASGVATTAYRTVTEFTATSGQTTFSVPSYTVGYIDVYRNGVMLGTADFTATSGTTVVLASGATAGDLIRTESFYVSSVLNAIPAVANAVTETYINTGAVTTTKIADANVTQAKLASGVAGNGPAFSVARTTDVSVPNGTSTKVIFATESFDTNSCYDTSNGRFTPNVAGYYQITASLGWLTPPSGQSYDFYIAKNGAIGTPAIRVILSTASQNPIFQGSYLLYLNGSTDYVEIYAYQGTGSTQTIIGGTDRTWFQGFMVRSA
jgi:hypothetical protein